LLKAVAVSLVKERARAIFKLQENLRYSIMRKCKKISLKSQIIEEITNYNMQIPINIDLKLFKYNCATSIESLGIIFHCTFRY